MDLGETRIRERGASLVGTPDGSRVGSLSIGREIKHVAISAGRQHNRFTRVRFDRAVNEIASNDATCSSVDDDQVEHLGARKHLHTTTGYLPLERLIRSKQQLLSGLTTGVKSPRYLCATKGTVRQQAPVLTRERDSLRDALVDDVDAQLSEPINVGFARTEVSTFDGVVKESIDAVAVVLIILSRVDSALCGDAVCPARRILKAEALYVVTQFAHARGCGGSSQARSNDEDRVFSLVGRIHQLHLEAVPVPFFRQRTGGYVRVEPYGHRSAPTKTARGTLVNAAQTRTATANDTRWRNGSPDGGLTPMLRTELQAP